MVFPPSQDGLLRKARLPLGVEGETSKTKTTCPAEAIGNCSGASTEALGPRCNLRGHSSTLSGLQNFCHPKAPDGLETDFRCVGFKSVVSHPFIQNDQSQSVGLNATTTSLDGLTGLEGRLPSRSHKEESAQVLGTHMLEETVLLPQPSVRPCASPVAIFSPDGSGLGPTPSGRRASVGLHRRPSFV